MQWRIDRTFFDLKHTFNHYFFPHSTNKSVTILRKVIFLRLYQLPQKIEQLNNRKEKINKLNFDFVLLICFVDYHVWWSIALPLSWRSKIVNFLRILKNHLLWKSQWFLLLVGTENGGCLVKSSSIHHRFSSNFFPRSTCLKNSADNPDFFCRPLFFGRPWFLTGVIFCRPLFF